MSRVFNARNALGATVYDVDTKQKIEHVLSIDIDVGEVVRAHHPLRVVGDEVDSYVTRYRSIYPIYGGNRCPVLFHCYGAIQ